MAGEASEEGSDGLDLRLGEMLVETPASSGSGCSPVGNHPAHTGRDPNTVNVSVDKDVKTKNDW